MAESCAKAFGRYLRVLRERRGLALDDVASMSRSYADPVAKSYLSRVENGLLSLALPKMIPLCRIYEIPTEVLIERLELDMELDKVGCPETSGLQFEEMLSRGKAAFERGNRWHQYGYYRDSTLVAPSSDLAPRLRDTQEQIEYAWMLMAAAASSLDRHQLALYEMLRVKARCHLGPRFSALLFERLASVYTNTGDRSIAAKFSDSAIEVATASGASDLLGYFYTTRAIIARRNGEISAAIRLHQEAFEAFKSSDREIECSRSLFDLAVAYMHASRDNAARRALASSERYAVRHRQQRIRGLIRVAWGELDCKVGDHEKASFHWREAADIAKGLSDKELEFQADFYLFCRARDTGNEAQAKALKRRLKRIACWIRSELPELEQFRQSAMVSRA